MNLHRPLPGWLLRLVPPLALALGPAVAHAAAGQVLFALGRVEIQRDGQTFAAPRGAAVEVGDTISTGPTGLAQVRLRDGALLSLRHGSTLKVEDFQLPQAAPAADPPATAAPTARAPGRSVLRLVRGAFRTVTGLIGHSAGDAYSVVTPVATIGIRGTDYSAAYCEGDCGATPDGLYVGVSSGEIELNNAAGELALTNDQYGYVRDESTPPDRELAPPEVLETPIAPADDDDEPDERDEGGELADASGDDRSGPGDGFRDGSDDSGEFETGETAPEGSHEARPERGRVAFAGNGFKGKSEGVLYVEGDGALLGFDTTSVSANIGTAQNYDQGGDGSTGLQWGRWNGGVANTSSPSGAGTLDLTVASLHWIHAAGDDAPVLQITGTRSYELVGGTNPTDNNGNVGVLGSATLFADFTNQSVSSTVDLTMGTTNWQANGSGTISGGAFTGTYAVFAGGQTGSGGFSGFFTNDASGAGLAYELTSSVTTVNGVAGFEATTAADGL